MSDEWRVNPHPEKRAYPDENMKYGDIVDVKTDWGHTWLRTEACFAFKNSHACVTHWRYSPVNGS